VPWGDDWDLIPVVLRDLHGRLEWVDFWTQHNEHRMVLVKAIVIVLARLNRFDVRAELWFGFVVGLLILLLLRDLLLRTVGPPYSVVLTAVASLFSFSAVLYEQWLWAIVAVQWSLHSLGMVAIAWTVARWPGRWRALLGGLSVGFATSLAVASGVVLNAVPLFGAMGSALVRREPLPKGRILVGISVPIAFGAIYVHRLRVVSAMDTALADGVRFWLAYLGLPLGFPRPGLSLAVGLAGIVLLVVAIVAAAARDARPALPWALLAGETMAVAGVTAIGRGSHGAAGAMVSRYGMVAALFWVALAALMTLAVRPPAPAWRRRAALVVASLAATAYASAYGRGLNLGVVLAGAQSTARLAVIGHETASDHALRVLYPDPAGVRRYARALDARGLSLFSDPGSRSRPAPPRRQDSLANAAPWGYEGLIEHIDCNAISGWAWYPLEEVPLGLEIYDGERILGTTSAGRYRADLRSGGKGDGAHAFSYTLGPQVADGRPHRIRVQIAGVRGALPRLGRGGTILCPPR
jgi:hypothetical protein